MLIQKPAALRCQSLQAGVDLGIQAYLEAKMLKNSYAYIVNRRFRALKLTEAERETLTGLKQSGRSEPAPPAEQMSTWQKNLTGTYCIVPLALRSDRFIQVFLTPVAEALDGLGDATQRAVNLL